MASRTGVRLIPNPRASFCSESFIPGDNTSVSNCRWMYSYAILLSLVGINKTAEIWVNYVIWTYVTKPPARCCVLLTNASIPV